MKLKDLKVGGIYLAESEGVVSVFHIVSSHSIQHVASNRKSWCASKFISDYKRNELKEISVRDLPLYINYPKVHPQLSELIKQGDEQL